MMLVFMVIMMMHNGDDDYDYSCINDDDYHVDDYDDANDGGNDGDCDDGVML